MLGFVGALVLITQLAASPARTPAEFADRMSADVVVTQTTIETDAQTVWNAVRDVYNVDTRLFPGLVTRVDQAGDVRTVTFSTGYVVTERIMEIDEEARRITYAAFGGRAAYHSATMQVVADEAAGSRVIWRTEFRPAELRPLIEQNMRRGSEVMKRHLEATTDR